MKRQQSEGIEVIMKLIEGFPILCYHRVHSDDDPATPDVMEGQFCGHVTRSVFRMQMQILAENGFSTVTHNDIGAWLYEGKELPEGRLVGIDFDDNRLNVYENAFPVMNEYGYKGTVFVISRLASGELPSLMQFPAMNWEKLSELKEAGWTIGAHTASHAQLAKLSEAEGGLDKVDLELKTCVEEIKENLGFQADCFAYPYGNWNEDVEVLVKKYFRTARQWRPDFHTAGYNTLETDPYRLQSFNVSMQTSEGDFLEILNIKEKI